MVKTFIYFPSVYFSNIAYTEGVINRLVGFSLIIDLLCFCFPSSFVAMFIVREKYMFGIKDG